jgi:hypothetical protein
MVVIDGREPAQKPGKFQRDGVTLEVSYIDRDELQTPEQVLGAYHLAGSFHVPSVIADPMGWLGPLQRAVARDYTRRVWVERRVEDALARVGRNLAGLRSAKSLPDRVTAWFFAGGVVTHMLLVAGLKNPTVRKRYVAARSLLREYDRLDRFDELLALIGCARLSRAEVEAMLDRLAILFDTAKTLPANGLFFAADISDDGRAIAIDGSRTLIEEGFHREAVFWIVATWCRCQKIIELAGTPGQVAAGNRELREMLMELGINSDADIAARGETIARYLPHARELAEYIIRTNPEIEGDKHAQE